MFRRDKAALNCTRDKFSKALAAEGIPNRPGYISQVVYMNPLFQKRQAYLNSYFPFDLSNVSYPPGLCPTAEQILQTVVQIGISEFYTEQDIEDMITGIRKVVAYYRKFAQR
jgi:dTDP-4-amino-4,6-dideoxygalactose transaminase